MTSNIPLKVHICLVLNQTCLLTAIVSLQVFAEYANVSIIQVSHSGFHLLIFSYIGPHVMCDVVHYHQYIIHSWSFVQLHYTSKDV